MSQEGGRTNILHDCRPVYRRRPTPFKRSLFSDKVIANQHWISLCILLAKGLPLNKGLKEMKALASTYDYRCQPPPPPPSREAVVAMFEEACKGSTLTNVQAWLSKIVRDSKK